MAEDIPVTPAGTFDEPTWAEDGVWSPSPYESEGVPLGNVVGGNDFNEPRRKGMRWTRAMWRRMFPSDHGLWTTCLVKAGVWNVGDGTLDGHASPTWAFIDADVDGGVMVEYFVPAGAPHTFTANRDTYIALNEDGDAEYNEVDIDDPEPAPSAGYINVWLVRTDGTELVAAVNLIEGSPALLGLRTTGNLQVGGGLSVTGDAFVGTLTTVGNAAVNGNLTVTGNTTLGNESTDTTTVEGSLAVIGDTVLGADPADTLTVKGPVTLEGTIEVDGEATFKDESDFEEGITTTATGATVALDVTGSGSVSASIIRGAGAEAITAVTDSANPTVEIQQQGAGLALKVDGDTDLDGSTSVKGSMIVLGGDGGSLASDPTANLEWNGTAEFNGRLRVLTGTSVGEGDLSKDGSGNLQYRDSSATRKVCANSAGWVKGYGHADSIAAAATVTLDTQAVAPTQPADLDVAAEFWIQRASAGVVTIALIEVGGAGQIGTNADFHVSATGGDIWDVVTFCRRRVSADTTPRVYRLEVAGGGANVTLNNARVTVTPTA